MKTNINTESFSFDNINIIKCEKIVDILYYEYIFVKII